LTAFGLHLFYGGGYCRYVSLNNFSPLFPCSILLVGAATYGFDTMSVSMGPLGMEYFGSDVLLVVPMSSSLPVLADSPKIIGPSLFPV
jgi:hypothetical protein